MASPLHPLEVNAVTGEPFLRLPPPHAHIIITPMRTTDAPALVPLLNDPRIYLQLASVPHPYDLHAHAEPWVARSAAADAALLDALTAPAPPSWADGCPVHMLREQRADGTDALIGDAGLVRCRDVHLAAPGAPAVVPAPDVAARLKAEHDARLAGDPALVWSFGDWLTASHHGRGIMTAAIGALVHRWAVPRMGARRIVVEAFEGNVGSVRVFEKNGFVLRGTAQRAVEIRGEWRNLHILEWTLPAGEDTAGGAAEAEADPAPA